MRHEPTTSAELRAYNLARLLRAVHEGDGKRTRAQLTRQLNLARGTATVLVRDLAGRQLIEELAGVADGSRQRSRGRPTGTPSAHPDGPVVLAVDLRDDSFSVAAFEVTGRAELLDSKERGAGSGASMLAEASQVVAAHKHSLGNRVVGIGVAVPSPVSAGRMVQPTLLDWRGADVAAVFGGHRVFAGNDATLAGLAEARRGALRGVAVAVHLHIATGIGGVLLTGGRPVLGGSGAAGEFGHMPLTGGSLPCRCGSVGCWELDAGTRGLLRRAGRAEHGDRLAQAHAVIDAAPTDPVCAAALAHVARALGNGVGALVNAHDPEAVGLSGLAAAVYEAAPDDVADGYAATLMRFRRPAPPPLVPSSLGDLGVVTGAAELAFDEFLTPHGLANWRCEAAEPAFAGEITR